MSADGDLAIIDISLAARQVREWRRELRNAAADWSDLNQLDKVANSLDRQIAKHRKACNASR